MSHLQFRFENAWLNLIESLRQTVYDYWQDQPGFNLTRAGLYSEAARFGGRHRNKSTPVQLCVLEWINLQTGSGAEASLKNPLHGHGF